MRIYLATRYSRRAEADALADVLHAQGHEVVSTWHCQALEALDATILDPDQADIACLHASVDVANISHAECVLLLANPGEPGRGGKHFECGLAYGLHIPIVVIGGAEHIFHRLPDVTHFNSIQDWLGTLAVEIA